MFTGIVQGLVTVVGVESEVDLTRIELAMGDLANGIELGASVAVNGTCLTVTRTSDSGAVCFDIIKESLKTTNLGDVVVGTQVNVERSFKVGDEVGGHIVSGHVDGMATVLSVTAVGDSHELWFRAPADLARFVAAKGSVTLDGVSLTVNDVKGSDFSINVIEHTWTVTTLGTLAEGQNVNMEIDMLARYVARLAESDSND